MAIQTAFEKGSEAAQPNWAGEMRYVARQPILNLSGHVHAYELLFRSASDAVLSPDGALSPGTDISQVSALNRNAVSIPDANAATRTMLDNAVIFGMEWLTHGLPAFVNCTVEALTEDLVLVLAPGKTVLAIPADVELTPKLLDCCRALKARGFQLALDDFTWNASLLPLAELADYIRLDFTRFGEAERQVLRRLDGPSLAMVAKKVETQEDYQQARGEGFTLFQGGYFCHPVLLKKRKLPANKLLHFVLVRQLHHDPIDVRQVSQLVLRDASLTYRLLRLVNSPIYAIQREIRSIESAIIAMGEETLRRIVSLAVLSELNGEEPPEIMHMALVRARFCELAASLCRLDPAEQYLLGMLSLVPAMLRLPMEELTPSMPLRSEICEALQGTMNPERRLLAWIESHERGDWEACDRIVEAQGLSQKHATGKHLSHEQLMRCYAESAIWAEAALRSAA
jgi:EAL and modified HD-GYP domain-containing signal transduction protein